MTSPVRDLLRMLDRYKWQYLLSGVLLILSILFRSFEPKILQIAVDGVISWRLENQNPGTSDGITDFFYQLLPAFTVENTSLILLGLALMYMAISVLRGGFLFAADAIKAWCSENVAKIMRDRAFAHIQRLPMSYFSRITRGELIQRCTGDIDTIKGFMKDKVLDFIRVIAIFVFSFIMMAIVNLEFALISICLTPLIGLTSYWFFKKEKKVWHEHEEESDRLNNMVQENLNGIRVVAAYANEAYEIDRFQQQNLRKRKIGFRHNLVHAWFWPLSDFLGLSQIVIAIVFGGYFAINGQVTVGELLSFYTYIFMVAWPMRQLGKILSQMGMATVAMERMAEVMAASQESEHGENIGSIAGEIEFREVSFAYGDNVSHALSQVSFSVKSGEKVAIIGPTGSGKSTLIKLLLRLYEPVSGEIILDGKPLKAFSRKSLRKRIGLALQKPFLFSTTIRNNIAYTRPRIDDQKVRSVAKLAQVAEIRDIFPQGYETLVGEKGVTLSGGQKQRVALARTLLPDPEVLILDDITSAVDNETEQEIFKALKGEMSGKTTLIISHRITSIQQADRVLVMDQGRIVQEGTPAELAKVPGYYQEIHRIQSEIEREILNS